MHEGFLFDNRVIILDGDASREIWKMGFYGKPLGIPKPKAPDFDKPLILDLIEAIYLVKKGVLYVKDPKNERGLSLKMLIDYAKRSYENFDEKYMVYEDLREKGYIVISGLKFGTDFAVYKKGPGLEHAPYIVDVLSGEYEINTDELIRAGRLATSVKKRFIIAIPNKNTGKIEYLVFKWWKP